MVVNIFSLINEFQDRYPVDVNGLARALGIEVNYAYLGKDVSGMIERTNTGSYRITVNENDPRTRQRFTIAHELGHFIYHKDKMGEGIDDDRMYRSTNVGKYHNTNIGPREETQANKFAASLLMPMDIINQLKSDGINDCGMLADMLDVSKHAMCIRLGEPYEG
ncbi:ImmA/IrrE family metallo-endopeptidase [Emcibacter nanhaiensis]|nr:ImmA/IrrE family metallo-endopeptidase [Emcibacter nanhaiensis]